MAKINFTRLFSYSELHSACMKGTLLFTVLIFALIGCGGSAQVHMPQDNPAVPHSSPAATPCSNCSGVVFVGDSIFGRLTVEDSFIRAGYIDAGMFGERTDEMRARFADVISGAHVCHGYQPPAGEPPDATFPFECTSLSVQPRTVVIMGGWNNFFQNNPGNTALDDITAMAKMAEAKGIKVIVCTLYPFDPAHPASWMVPTGNAPVTFFDVWRIPLNDGIKEIPGIAVADIDSVFKGQSNYTGDGVHPNFGPSGNGQMLNAISSLI